MLRNYLTIAIRMLVRYRAQSAINIGGLALGLAGCLLILTYVHYERSYDNCDGPTDRAMYASEIDWGKITVTTAGLGGDIFKVDAVSGSGNHFLITKTADGSFARTCTTGGNGGCRSDETW